MLVNITSKYKNHQNCIENVKQSEKLGHRSLLEFLDTSISIMLVDLSNRKTKGNESGQHTLLGHQVTRIPYDNLRNWIKAKRAIQH